MLPTLTGYQQSSPMSINDAGLVAGVSYIAGQGATAAVIWQNGAVVDLNTPLPSTSPWYLQEALHITNNGIIVGQGLYNGTQMEFELTLGSGSVGTTIQAALQSYQSGQLSSPVTVLDNAANLLASLGQLLPLVNAGGISSIGLTDSGTPALALTGSQLSADRPVLATLSSPVALNVTGATTVSALTPSIVAELSAPIAVSDSAANVQAAILKLDQAAIAGKLGTITLTDSGTPTLTLAGGELNSGGALLHVSGNYRLTLTTAANISVLTPSILPHIGSVAVADSSENIGANLDKLETLVRSGTVTSITVGGYQSPINITASQFAGDSDALAALTGPYALSVSGLTVTQALTIGQTPHLYCSVTDSASEIQSHFDQLASLAQAGILGGVNFSDGTPNVISVNGSQLGADLALIGLMGLVPNLTVIGATTAAAATSLLHSLYANLTAPLSIVDTAANVQAQIDNLEVFAHAGRISSITLTDSGTAVLSLTTAQQTADADVLRLIASPYTTTTSTAATAGLALSAQNTPVAVSDTASNISTYFDQLESLTASGKLTSVVVTDGSLHPLTISTSQFVNDGALSARLASPYSLQIQLGDNVMTTAQLFGALNQGDQFTGSGFSINDSAANISASLDRLESLYSTSGKPVSIGFTGSATLSVSPQQLVSDDGVLWTTQSINRTRHSRACGERRVQR